MASMVPVPHTRIFLSGVCVLAIFRRFFKTRIRAAPKLRAVIQGQLLRITPHHQAAIYLRDGALWVADFVDGHGTLVDAAVWFRFNCPALETTHARRRMVRESAIPLSTELVQRIEELHARSPGAERRAAGRASEGPRETAAPADARPPHPEGGDAVARSRLAGAHEPVRRRDIGHQTIARASSIGLVVLLLVVALIWLQFGARFAR
jgi:hypothetical protein